jgi:filamentous hemagglutinin
VNEPPSSPEAQSYQSGAAGAQEGKAPALRYTDAAGKVKRVKFDGVDGDVLIDRKLSVVRTPKAQRQVLRQSQALSQNGLKGRWELPTEGMAQQARNLFKKLGVTNIDVKVVPK